MLTQSDKEKEYRFFENWVIFLQDNEFTTRKIQKNGEKATDESKVMIKDLTEDGLAFYLYGIKKWRKKIEKAKNKDKAINDFIFIENRLKEFREKQNNKTE